MGMLLLETNFGSFSRDLELKLAFFLSSNFLEFYDNCKVCLETGIGCARFDTWGVEMALPSRQKILQVSGMWGPGS